ncbi:hypothetical protein D1872_299770 [compost metagenome]
MIPYLFPIHTDLTDVERLSAIRSRFFKIQPPEIRLLRAFRQGNSSFFTLGLKNLLREVMTCIDRYSSQSFQLLVHCLHGPLQSINFFLIGTLKAL